MQAPELLYYYRPLRRYPNVYKCAGHGAEDPKHRSFYEPYFTSHDKDLVYGPGCIVSPYAGDRANAEKLQGAK
jgi:hypothetical protein